MTNESSNVDEETPPHVPAQMHAAAPARMRAAVPARMGDAVPARMHAAVIQRYGTPDEVSITDVAVPSCGEGEVLIRVEASSLNALDWHFLTGTPYLLRLMEGLRVPKRTILGADVAGVVVGIGAGVNRLCVGDSVWGESNGGGFAQYVATKEANLVHKPEGVSFENVAATPVAGLTALQGLRTHGKVQPGEHVLINGAAGGVGTYAVQIAKTLGATVTAVCSTRNVEMVSALGADNVIDYTEADFVSSGVRYDVMFDNVGQRPAADSLAVLGPGSRYVVTTGPKDKPWLEPMRSIAKTAFRFWRSDASFHQFVAEANVEDLTYLGQLLDAGSVVPQIQRVVDLDGVAEGLTEIGTGHARAKIVVRPG